MVEDSLDNPIQAPTESSTDEKTQQFIDKVRYNLGSLIPINAKTSDGKQMFVQVRNIPIPSEEYTYSKSDNIVKNNDAAVFVDIFVPDSTAESGYSSVAHRDCVIRKEDKIAVSAGIRENTQFYAKDLRNKEADRRWKGHSGTNTAEDLQNQGLGSFMIAISLPVLKDLGVKAINVGSLKPVEYGGAPIRAAWKKFGVEHSYDPYPIDQVISHPNVNKTIAKFAI